MIALGVDLRTSWVGQGSTRVALGSSRGAAVATPMDRLGGNGTLTKPPITSNRGSLRDCENAANALDLRARELTMANAPIEEGYEVFLSDHDKPFGAVRVVAPELIVYVENAGEFTLPPEAVSAVHAQKVIVERAKLDRKLRQAIAHAHDAEDPDI